MLHIMKDDFDENADDILNSINNMLKKKQETSGEKDKINNKKE